MALSLDSLDLLPPTGGEGVPLTRNLTLSRNIQKHPYKSNT
jgi:hypothetical protein